MLIRSRKGWELPDSAATPESVYLNRRSLLKAKKLFNFRNSLFPFNQYAENHQTSLMRYGL